MNRQAVIATAAFLALAAAAAGFLYSRPPEQPARSQAPQTQGAVGRLLALPLLDPAGKETTLARWQGKPLIINFWATWCPPCLTEMPVFSRLQEQNPNVQFIGIAVDTAQNVQEFAAAHPMSYPLLRSPEDTMSLMVELGNDRSGLPFTLAIDTAGQVRHVRLGSLSEADAKTLISSLK